MRLDVFYFCSHVIEQDLCRPSLPCARPLHMATQQFGFFSTGGFHRLLRTKPVSSETSKAERRSNGRPWFYLRTCRRSAIIGSQATILTEFHEPRRDEQCFLTPFSEAIRQVANADYELRICREEYGRRHPKWSVSKFVQIREYL